MSDYGMLATLLLTIQVLMCLMEMGTTTALMRFGDEYEKSGDMAGLLGGVILLSIFSCAGVTLVTLAFSDFIFTRILHTGDVRLLIGLACGAAAAQTMFIKILSYYRVKGQGMKFTIASISTAVILFAVNWYLLVILNQGISGVLSAQIITYGISWIALTLFIGVTSGIRFAPGTAKKLAIFGFPLVFAMFGHLAADTSAVYFLSYFKNLEEVAIYSLGYKIASVTGIILILPFELAYEPFVYSNKGRPGIEIIISRLLTYLMFAFTFVSVGVLFVFRPLFPFIAPSEYAPAGKLLVWLFSGFAFLGFRGIGQSLLHFNNKTSVTGITITFFTMLTIILQYFLIPRMGMYALVFTFNFMNIAIGLSLIFLGSREVAVPFEKRRLVVIAMVYFLLMLTGHELWDAASVIFYTFIPTIAMASLWLLYTTGFFLEDEKTVIRSVGARLMSVISGRPAVKNG